MTVTELTDTCHRFDVTELTVTDMVCHRFDWHPFGTSADMSGQSGTDAKMSWVQSVLGPKCLDTQMTIRNNCADCMQPCLLFRYTTGEVFNNL